VGIPTKKPLLLPNSKYQPVSPRKKKTGFTPANGELKIKNT
jgi:hypothetical protein